MLSRYNFKIWAVAFLVALLTILVYLPALQNGFVNWDDPQYIYENPEIKSIDFKSLKWMFTTFDVSNWHPLTWLSHAVDYAIWGLNPMGHHLTSIIFHGLNTFLVVILIVHLILSPPGRRGLGGGGAIIAGAVTGLLFGLHPLHVESVAWVSERKDVLCAFFFLLSLLSYLKYTSSSLQNSPESPQPPFEKGGLRGIYYSLCLLLFTMALMSKPMALTLPVVLIILDFYPLERLEFKSAFTSQRKVLIEKLPFLGLSIASSVITVMAQQSGGAIKSLNVHSLGERFLVGIRALCFYLIKMLWPTEIAPLYPYPSGIALFTLEYVGAFILVSGITAFCIYSWKKQKVWSAVWAYYITTLLPVLGIIQVGDQAAADRYTYLPGLGPAFLAGLCAAWLWEKAGAGHNSSILKRAFVIIPLILIISSLSLMTIKQIEIWRDSITLWNKELKLYSTPLAYNNRGNAYLSLDKYQQAIEDYNKAVELNPEYALAYYNRGNAYLSLDKYQQAIEDFDRAIALNPHYVNTYNNRGIAYAKKEIGRASCRERV